VTTAKKNPCWAKTAATLPMQRHRGARLCRVARSRRPFTPKLSQQLKMRQNKTRGYQLLRLWRLSIDWFITYKQFADFLIIITIISYIYRTKYLPYILNTLVLDSATLQSTQWIINAEYNQRIVQSTPLYTAWINHQIWGQYMCGAPERRRTFSTVITASVVQDAGVDCMMRWLYVALHVS
jgi:hypothetical protein